MPIDLADVVKVGSKRVFLQAGGPGPLNALAYYGIDTQYVHLKGASKQLSGGYDPVVVADPFKPNQWVTVGKMNKPIGTLPTGTLEVYEKIGTIPFIMGDLSCPLSVYLVNSVCKDPSAFDNGWVGYIEVWAAGKVTDVDMGDRSSRDSDDPVVDNATMTFDRAYVIGGVQASNKATAAIAVREQMDVTVAPNRLCGNCGVVNNGFKWQYTLHKEASGVTAASVLYSVDGGNTWTALPITGIVNTEAPRAIRVIGNKLVVLSPTGTSATQSALYYTTINQTTGIPGTTWTKVGTGFDAVGGRLGNDMFVLSEREVFIVGGGGYVYKSTDITAGVSIVDAGGATTANLFRIRGRGDTLVAHGATGKTIVSQNRGQSWSLTLTDPYANTGSAVEVISPTAFWVGSASGDFSFTLDGGVTWTAKSITAALGAAPLTVDDILAVSPEALWVAATTAGPVSNLLASNNGGRTFAAATDTQASRIFNWPTGLQRINRIAAPLSADYALAVNNFVAVGLGATTFGAIVLGASNFV